MAVLTLLKHAVPPSTHTVGNLGLAPNELAICFAVLHNEQLILLYLRPLLNTMPSFGMEVVQFYPEIWMFQINLKLRALCSLFWTDISPQPNVGGRGDGLALSQQTNHHADTKVLVSMETSFLNSMAWSPQVPSSHLSSSIDKGTSHNLSSTLGVWPVTLWKCQQWW